jgi:DNA gyrase subunit A
VKLINLRENDSIAAVAKVMKDEDDLDETDILNMEVETEDGTSLDTDNPNPPSTS